MMDHGETDTYNEVKRLVDELAKLANDIRYIEVQKTNAVKMLIHHRQKLLEESLGDSSPLTPDWLRLFDITGTTSDLMFQLRTNVLLNQVLSGWQLRITTENESAYLGLVHTRHALANFLLALPKEF